MHRISKIKGSILGTSIFRNFVLSIFLLIVSTMITLGQTGKFIHGYAPVNGLKMYYEIHGKGEPLVLLHGGGSTIYTTFGRILPSLAKNKKVIAIELQAHGHTNDIDRPLTFEQDADDVAALLKFLKIENADFFGFSNGGSTVLQIAIRHPKLVRKVIAVSAMYKRDGLYSQFWDFMNRAELQNMPAGLKDAYLKVAPDPKNLQALHDKCLKRMLEFKDWNDDDLRSITAPTLILIGDADVIRPEHAVEMYRLVPHSHLSILPGSHGECIGEVTTPQGSKIPDLVVSIIDEFLASPMPPAK
jgi:pimeloyl-ACP methyl ester carboxylesterase